MSKKAKAVFQAMLSYEWVVVYVGQNYGYEGETPCRVGGHIPTFPNRDAALDARQRWGSLPNYQVRPTNLSQDELRELLHKNCKGKLLK